MKQNLLIAIIAVAAFGAGLAGFCLGGNNMSPGAAIFGQTSTEQTHSSYIMDKSVYEGFAQSANATSTAEEKIVAGVVPHHLIAGKYISGFFAKLRKQNPEVVVIIGPNHPQAGANAIVSGLYDWNTPYGKLPAATKIISQLSTENLLTTDDKLVGNENSIGALVPFVKQTWGKTKIVPIIVKNSTKPEQLQNLAGALAKFLPKNSLVLASVDFSHYLPAASADFHDELSINVLQTGDSERVDKMEIDCRSCARFLLDYTELVGARKFDLLYHTNSAYIMNQPKLAETTSHVLGYFTKGEPTASKTVSLQFFGDMMLERNVERAMGTSGLDYLLGDLRGKENRFFDGVDLFIANLEGPFAPERVPTTKSIAFRFDPQLAGQLKKYNFDVFSLANNHLLDMGWKNLDFTKKILEQNGLKYFGDQLREGPEYTLITEGEEKIAFIGVNNTDHNLDMKKLKEALEKAATEAKYVIVMPHWGTEYQSVSNKYQRDLARWLIDNGATAVIGGHPHVTQETETYNGAPIFYSLGNFIFDQYFSKETQEGFSVGLILENGKVKSYKIFPFYGVKSKVRLK